MLTPSGSRAALSDASNPRRSFVFFFSDFSFDLAHAHAHAHDSHALV